MVQIKTTLSSTAVNKSQFAVLQRYQCQTHATVFGKKKTFCGDVVSCLTFLRPKLIYATSDQHCLVK